jgi:hypothetical protein
MRVRTHIELTTLGAFGIVAFLGCPVVSLFLYRHLVDLKTRSTSYPFLYQDEINGTSIALVFCLTGRLAGGAMLFVGRTFIHERVPTAKVQKADAPTTKPAHTSSQLNSAEPIGEATIGGASCKLFYDGAVSADIRGKTVWFKTREDAERRLNRA